MYTCNNKIYNNKICKNEIYNKMHNNIHDKTWVCAPLPIASIIRMLKHCVPASTHSQQGLTGYFHML